MAGDLQLATPEGDIELRRRPFRAASPLRAWDGADEFVLTHLAESPPGAEARRWLVVNDAFGALGTALAPRQPWWWSDSAVARAALADNLARNGRDPDAVIPIAAVQEPPPSLDVVIVKIPKSRSLLDDQLRRLRRCLHADSVVIGAGMTRHVHSSTVASFERFVGPTRTTLARRRARLLLSTPARDAAPVEEGEMGPAGTRFRLVGIGPRSADGGIEVWNHPGVFSSRRLDQGTEFLLDVVASIHDAERVVDLGCGNGVVGTVLALRNAGAELTFTDESSLAIASARRTFSAACPDRSATFVWGDGAEGIADASVDLVVLNPPFHEQHVIDAEVGAGLIGEAHRILAPGGSLIVVANRHLGHHVTLARRFGAKPLVLASNPKFVVWRSTR